jgi:transcriptional regulator with XRE-family HTH domain
VGERKSNPSKKVTTLAQLRVRFGITQTELAEASGVGLRALQEIERGEIDNPRIRYLINIAMALGLELQDVCEEEWLAWTEFPNGPTEPRMIPANPDRFDR